MITRIVRMQFASHNLEQFIEIFFESQELIKGFEGCIDVELMKDVNNPDCYFTISKWQSEEHLNLYRESNIFRTIWAKVKPLFSEKAEAWSLTNQNTAHSPLS